MSAHLDQQQHVEGSSERPTEACVQQYAGRGVPKRSDVEYVVENVGVSMVSRGEPRRMRRPSTQRYLNSGRPLMFTLRDT
jgi:hypothetical protein